MTDASQVHAIVVGVETYEEPKWDVLGPAANAIAIVEQLLRWNVPHENIHLFLAEKEREAGRELQRIDVTRVNKADYDRIDDCLRVTLRSSRSPVRKIFFYWSGHGVTDIDGDRIVFCSNYSKYKDSAAVNMTALLRWFQDMDSWSLSQTVALIDTCGVRGGNPVHPTGYETKNTRRHQQVVFFASPESEYAKTENGMGVFTANALDVMKSFQAYPDAEAFSEKLNNFLKEIDIEPYWIDVQAPTHKGDYLVGRRPDHGGDPTGDLIERVIASHVSEPVIRQHYVATVRQAMLDEPLLNAAGVGGMIRELRKLPSGGEFASVGLVEFLERLRSHPMLAASIGEWLDRHARQEDRLAATRVLELEKGPKMLIFDIRLDPRGRLVELRSHLRYRDFSLVRGCRLEPRPATSWAALGEAVIAALDELDERNLLEDIEIHVLAEPFSFDWPFHQLPSGRTDTPLGKTYAALVHYRERQCRKSSDKKAFWQEQAPRLAAAWDAGVDWLRLAAAGEIPEASGFWTVDFSLPSDPKGAEPAKVMDRKKRLHDLVAMGAPFVYWVHGEDTAADFAERFRNMVEGPPRLSLIDVPKKLFKARLSGRDFAQRGSLLWDTPDFDPYTSHEGVHFE